MTSPLVYRALTTVNRVLMRVLFRPRVRGREHLPSSGFVLGANHLSGFDSLALAYALYPRDFSSMAKVQLFERPLLGPLVRALGAFPAHGGGEPDGAITTAARLARAGRAVVIFPSGARRRTDPRQRPRTGAARAALQANVPLVPTALHGTDGWRRLARWQIVFGAPVPLDGLGSKEATQRLWEAITELYAGLERGSTSGTTAGRTESGNS